jgi:hypothetical protein
LKVRIHNTDFDDFLNGGAMRMASVEGAQKLSKALGLKATHPLVIAGIIGAVVDIGKGYASGTMTFNGCP